MLVVLWLSMIWLLLVWDVCRGGDEEVVRQLEEEEVWFAFFPGSFT